MPADPINPPNGAPFNNGAATAIANPNGGAFDNGAATGIANGAAFDNGAADPIAPGNGAAFDNGAATGIVGPNAVAFDEAGAVACPLDAAPYLAREDDVILEDGSGQPIETTVRPTDGSELERG